MYNLYHKNEAIKQIQRYLSVVNPSNVIISENGNFDEKTRQSVKSFQSSKGLKPTGTVDRITFDILYKEYLITCKTNFINNCPTFIKFPILPGNNSLGIKNLKINLRVLLEYYGYQHSVRDSQFYDEETVRAINYLRSVYMMKSDNIIDEELYLMIMLDLASVLKSNNYFQFD